MSELALNDAQRNAFAGHFDGVGVTELMGREAPSHAGVRGGSAELGARRRARPAPSARRAVDDAEQRTNRKLKPHLERGRELLPRPFVYADFAAARLLAASGQQRPAAVVEIRLGERQRFVDAETGAPVQESR